MESPKIVEKKPVVMEVQPGTYYWCSCGKSGTQPFCDGAHKGSQFTPVAFSIEKAQKVALCNCKHSVNPPFCDGAHVDL